MSKLKLELSGQDGNAFFIIGRAVRVAKKAGWSKEELEKFTKEAMSGDYDNVLKSCSKYFDVT